MFIKRKRPQKIVLRKSVKKDLVKEHFKWIVRAVIAISVIVVLCIGLYYLRLALSSVNFFDIKTIKVQGFHYLPESLVFDKIKSAENKDIFDVSKSDIELQLKQLTEIKSAKLIKYYPNKIIVKIKEREPLFCTLVEGKKFYVDEYGILLDYDTAEEFVFINYSLVNDPDKFQVLLNLRKVLLKYFPIFYFRIKKIEMNANFFIKLILKNDIIVILDNMHNYKDHKIDDIKKEILFKKIKFFNIVESDLVKKGLENNQGKEIDLRYFKGIEDLIIVR